MADHAAKGPESNGGLNGNGIGRFIVEDGPRLSEERSSSVVDLRGGGPGGDLPQVQVEADECPALRFSWRRLLQFSGPGLLMSIAYVDPGNLEGDLQTGAKSNYSLLWTMLWSTIAGLFVQVQAAKLGVVSKRNLAENCRVHYSPFPRYVLWAMTEIAIVGSDMQEVIGGAIAITLLSSGTVPLWAGVLTTSLGAFLILFLERLGVRKLEFAFAVFVGIMAVTFGMIFTRVGVPYGEVLQGLIVPRISPQHLGVAVGLVGALIMPHNLFLHSALVHSRRIESGDLQKREALLYFTIEGGAALAATVFINLFVISVFAKGFYGQGVEDIGLSTAGAYLGDRYGSSVTFIFGLGLLAAGYSSTITGTYTGQFVITGFLDLKVSKWTRIAITRLVTLAPTLLCALFKSQSSLDKLNEALNLLQAVQLPFALLPLIYFTNSSALMGERFKNSLSTKVGLYAVTSVLLCINAAAIGQAWLALSEASALATVGATTLLACYVAFVVYLFVGPQRWGALTQRLRLAAAGEPATGQRAYVAQE